MIEVTVAHLGLDRTTNTPVVILREKEGSRVLPIWIGPAEASAIAYIQIKLPNGKTKWGAGVDTNIELTSIKAVLSAMNRATAG